MDVMPLSFFQRVVEEKILQAQREGAFDNLPGRGKPLRLDDQTWVPEDLRVAYHVLKNAHVLPPEAELLKEIHTLEDLLKYVEDEGEKKALAKSIRNKIVRLDLLKRRSFSLGAAGYYGAKLAAKFSRR
ncbi:MAG TPA: DnaJ family domain-containing protein [Candidatus Binatia bacterium]